MLFSRGVVQNFPSPFLDVCTFRVWHTLSRVNFRGGNLWGARKRAAAFPPSPPSSSFLFCCSFFFFYHCSRKIVKSTSTEREEVRKNGGTKIFYTTPCDLGLRKKIKKKYGRSCSHEACIAYRKKGLVARFR